MGICLWGIIGGADVQSDKFLFDESNIYLLRSNPSVSAISCKAAVDFGPSEMGPLSSRRLPLPHV